MKLLILFFGMSLFAAESAKTIDILDPTWGKFVLRLEDTGKPAREPLRVGLTVTCRDQRANPNSVAPQAQELMNHDSICAFDRYAFDKDEKILTVFVSKSETVGDEAKCEKHWKQSFDMKKICAAWTSAKVAK